MTEYLLDTNVISEVRKPRPHSAVVAWFRTLRREQILLPSIVTWEIQRGIEATRSQDLRKAVEIEDWLDEVVASFQVISLDALCARECARIIAAKPDDLFEDAVVAATARVYGLVVATRNERDFRQFDVPVLNPFR